MRAITIFRITFRVIFIVFVLAVLTGFVMLANLVRVSHFVGAAENGDVSLVQQYIAEGINVNGDNLNGINAIQGASYGGHNKVVKVLLDAGASPNEGLYQAILMENTDTIRLLLSRGANVNRPDSRHSISPLEDAKHGSSEKIVKLLESKQ